MKLKPPTDKTPQGLDSCLRQEVAHYDAARRTVRTVRRGLYFADLSTEDRQSLSRQCDPEMREVDEALLRGLKAHPEFSTEVEVPIELFEGTLYLESAGAQLERVSMDLLGSLVDCTLTLRLGLHEMNGEVEGTVQALIQDAKTPWWQRLWYQAQWTEVGLLERLSIERGLDSRGQRDELEKSATDAAPPPARKGRKRGALGPRRSQLVTSVLDRGAAVEPIPALRGQPRTVLLLLSQKAGAYEDVATALIKVHGDLDAPTPNEAQRQRLNQPLAAAAPMVAAEQARQLRKPAARAVADAAPVTADALAAAVGKHDCCLDGTEETRGIVQGAGDLRTVAGGTRALMRDWILSWYKRAKAQATPGSTRYLDLTSAFEGSRMLWDKIVARQAQRQKQDEMLRNQAEERLDSARADLQAAQVVSDLRQGKEVDLATRLQAARHLRARGGGKARD